MPAGARCPARAAGRPVPRCRSPAAGPVVGVALGQDLQLVLELTAQAVHDTRVGVEFLGHVGQGGQGSFERDVVGESTFPPDVVIVREVGPGNHPGQQQSLNDQGDGDHSGGHEDDQVPVGKGPAGRNRDGQ